MNHTPSDEPRRFDGTWVEREVASLDPLAPVPTDVLDRQVRRHGRCLNEITFGHPPDPPADEAHPDRWLAERMCHGCPVQRACLETELRHNGENTIGVWGGLTDDDRRTLVAQWEARPERHRYARPDVPAPETVDVVTVEKTGMSPDQFDDAVRALAALIETWSSGSDHPSRATVGAVDRSGAR